MAFPLQVHDVSDEAGSLADQAQKLVEAARHLADHVSQLTPPSAEQDFFLTGLTVFVLAVFVGYYVVWRVTPALHSPLMSVTNAVSSVIIVGAMLAAGAAEFTIAKGFGLVAVMLASVNIFGGFVVTQRMLEMFRKKQ